MGAAAASSKPKIKLSSIPARLQTHPTHAELWEMGKALREQCPRGAHAVWQPHEGRLHPVELLEASNKGRIPQLVPVRHGRMLKSPFAWYRGTAQHMAADLAHTPVSGLKVQACGDAHLCNFGAYATPERRIIFDVNDLDETLPAPWEWDVKRLSTSFVLACRNNGLSEEDARDAALACVRSYREHMAEYAEMRVLEVWYATIDVEKIVSKIRDDEARQRAEKRVAKARERSVFDDDYPQLVHANGFAPTIRDNPPLIFHWREEGYDEHMANVRMAFDGYRESLSEYRRALLDRYQLMDIAVKVVGVGSVGTLCCVLLLMASEEDPLFLQVKEARPSVLEDYAGKSAHANHGQRVVVGCQLMQSASDLFLGWTQGQGGRQFYVRQLRDMKIKMIVDIYTRGVMKEYAALCGWCLARAHARSGEPAKISGYLGKSDRFDESIAEFSVCYADQSERDHEAFVRAVRKGDLDVILEEDMR